MEAEVMVASPYDIDVAYHWRAPHPWISITSLGSFCLLAFLITGLNRVC
jgi:hypothetical protein